MSGQVMSVSLHPGRLWARYCNALETTPLRMKAATAAVGFSLGDILAQIATRPRGERLRLDMFRTARLAFYGAAVGGPVGHFWYAYLDSVVFPLAPKSAKAIVSKIFLDQSLMSPMGACLFFSFTKLTDGFRVWEIGPTLQEKLLPTCRNSLKLWPAAHVINFAFIPPSQRILYINVIAIGWTALLSVAASQQQLQEPDVLEVVIAAPAPVVNVLPPDEEPITASQAFVEQLRLEEEPPPAPRQGVRRRAICGVKRAAGALKFW